MKRFIFYIDPETGRRHIEKHDVSIDEVDEFFNDRKYSSCRRKDCSYIARSKLKNGRYLEIPYRQLKDNLYFIITAYDIEDKEMIHALDDFIEE